MNTELKNALQIITKAKIMNTTNSLIRAANHPHSEVRKAAIYLLSKKGIVKRRV